jgi:hypothetical protein
MNLRVFVTAFALGLGGCIVAAEPEHETESDAELDVPGPDAGSASENRGKDAAATPTEPEDASLPASPQADAEPAAPPPQDPPPAPEPPTAAIDAPGDRRVVQDVVDLRPQETRDGATYTWTVVERPAGSTTRPVEALGGNPQSPLTDALEDDPATPTAVLFLDQVGTYTVTLLVVHQDGGQAEGSATFEAGTGSAIHIELSWDTPGDPNQTDTAGSDVDLHLNLPGGHWSTHSDCYYANPNPDWGAVGDPGDDPALDLDDIDGAGPENIHLARPEDTESLGGTYRIGVDYYRGEKIDASGSYGPSFATVRVYLDGALAWVNEAPRELVNTHDLWTVGEILWTPLEHRFRLVDQVEPGPLAEPAP